jgi:hypothetical protein
MTGEAFSVKMNEFFHPKLQMITQRHDELFTIEKVVTIETFIKLFCEERIGYICRYQENSDGRNSKRK